MRFVGPLLAAMLVPTAAFAWPWSQDMMNQPSIKPQEGPMAPFPKRSVPTQGIATTVANRDETKDLVNPIPVSEASLKKGKVLFRIYCAACHGLTGQADSPITAKIGAINLTDDYAQKNLTEGWIFGTITFGSAIMPAYGKPSAREDGRGSNDLSVEERWHVVNYVRHKMVQDAQAEPAKTVSAK
ncbi:MAG: c-type cytochrome [Gammaproteobacteria bacterium]|jgi:mono/diheme cytochrome c family protein|nr:c-type cytochrome [Gammaproteobacteria bacterium]